MIKATLYSFSVFSLLVLLVAAISWLDSVHPFRIELGGFVLQSASTVKVKWPPVFGLSILGVVAFISARRMRSPSAKAEQKGKSTKR